MRALFLDIDGVLNDHRKWPNKFAPILFENVEHLNHILEAVPDVQIVLSSAWRYLVLGGSMTQEGLVNLLQTHGLNVYERLHGITGKDPVNELRPYDDVEWWAEMGLQWRVEQIREYVQAHGLTRWAVLDDLRLDVEHLFQTNPQIGLTQEIAEQVITHFGSAEGTR